MNIALIIILIFIVIILLWALFGGRSDDTRRIGEDADDQDRTFRRRASDKEIEKEYPEKDAHKKRRKTDRDGDAEELKDDLPYKLPYSADEIIPESSQFRIYRRTLTNSEIYASKGDFATAISLFEGVRARINDVDVRFKIDANIEYLKQFKKRKEEEAKKKEEQAKRGISGDEDKKGAASELKIRFDGPIPETINFESLPETIRIGVPGGSPEMNQEKIVQQVVEKISGQMNNIREELSGIKGRQAGRPRYGDTVISEEIERLKNTVERLDGINELSGSDIESLKKITEGLAAGDLDQIIRGISGTLESRDGVMSHADPSGEIASLKGELQDLQKSIEGLTRSTISEVDHAPSVSPARFDSRDPSLSLGQQQDIMGKIPRQTAPDATPLREPDWGSPGLSPAGRPMTPSGVSSRDDAGRAGMGKGGSPSYSGAAERILEKERALDEADDFELLSEYGKDKDSDELTDDEIFEKILREDRDKAKESFEIIGEKKEDLSEKIITNEELEFKRREDESFYRNLLHTNKRKKRELPILKVSYDFTKLPDELGLSREKNIIEYSFYKYKPMLEKANEFIKKRKVRDAINYYKVVMSQNIPPEFKAMIRKNLSDLNEYLEKYLSGE